MPTISQPDGCCRMSASRGARTARSYLDGRHRLEDSRSGRSASCHRLTVRPYGFDIQRQEEWSRWVLEHGLPELPGDPVIGLGEAIPVSFWIGPDTAAVLHVRMPPAEWRNDDEDPFAECDVEYFVRTEDGWEGLGGGGSGPTADPPLARVEVPPRYVALDGVTAGSADETGVTALYGEVGTAASVIEVHQAGRVTRRPVSAPIGLQVVCAHVAEPFTVRVLDDRGEPLAAIEHPAGWDVE